MNDKGYEKLIRAIKSTQKASNNIMVGIMQGNSTCKINDLILDSDDLYIAEHLTTGYIKSVGGTYEEVAKLTQGDMVIVLRINEEKYAIIERLVEV